MTDQKGQDAHPSAPCLFLAVVESPGIGPISLIGPIPGCHGGHGNEKHQGRKRDVPNIVLKRDFAVLTVPLLMVSLIVSSCRT